MKKCAEFSFKVKVSFIEEITLPPNQNYKDGVEIVLKDIIS